MRYKFIVNPICAKGRALSEWPKYQRMLNTYGVKFDYDITQNPKDAISLTQASLEEGFERIVAVGGDGTINEVINGFFRDGKPINPKAELGIIPIGSGNDFIKAINIPPTSERAIKFMLQGASYDIDLATIEYRGALGKEQRLFNNIAGAGFDGEVTERANKMGKIFGPLTYFISIFLSFLSYKNKEAEVIADGKTIIGKFNSVVVANGQYFGGGMKIAPHAKLNDGLFDIVLIEDIKMLESVTYAPKLFKGTHLSHPKIKHFNAEEITLRTKERMVLQADGEIFGTADFTARIMPSAIKVICRL